ncbi:hypothetical protein NE237_013342 [Protea cynaroides]|uniref:F-box domain-containing protein n=1 Tax=Protea cynaroides TaxID=273540 RepID=A0A9Q0H3Q0_9MAGN|nr:hypothetical protein NE237_013342 [Protea cynaroides]
MSNWSDLPKELLVLVSKRLSYINDFVYFGAVCRSWQSVAADEKHNHPCQLPMLRTRQEMLFISKMASHRDEKQFIVKTTNFGYMDVVYYEDQYYALDSLVRFLLVNKIESKWVQNEGLKVENLGNTSLFVGDNSSFSFTVGIIIRSKEKEEQSNGDREALERVRSEISFCCQPRSVPILLVNTFGGGISPYFFQWNESFLLMGTQFAASVFLGTTLMHFLSNSSSTFENVTTKTYPFAFMLTSAGYLLTMFGDCVITFIVNASLRVDKIEVVEVEEGAAGKKMASVNVNPIFLRTSSFGDTLLLIFALYFHFVFEVIAVGVAGS